MRRTAIGFVILASLVAAPMAADAAVCAAGDHRAGCVGPNGAVTTTRPVAARPAGVRCADGIYRTTCMGPNGGAVGYRHTTGLAAVRCGHGVHRAGCAGPNGAVVTRRY